MELAETAYAGPLGNTYNFTLSWFFQHAGSIPGKIMIMKSRSFVLGNNIHVAGAREGGKYDQWPEFICSQHANP